MKTVVVLAGLPVEAHDHVRAVSSKRFAPDGYLALKPIKGNFGYPQKQVSEYIDEICRYMAGLDESTQVSVSLAYVDYGDQSTQAFVEGFFPFAIKRPLSAYRPEEHPHLNKNQRASKRNEYVKTLITEVAALRDRAALVHERTNVHNVTPLLLPIRNFRSGALTAMLSKLYHEVGVHPDPRQLLEQEVGKFLAAHPRVRPPNSQMSCFSDGALFFKSPGNNRHGFYRHTNKGGHVSECLLNARSRLGGTYDYTFHYDCTQVRGSLASRYPNCHGGDGQPKPTHVNIAPNDYVI